MTGTGAFRVFMRTIINLDTYNKVTHNKVGFIFIGSFSLSPAEDIEAVNQVTQALVRVGSKIGS